MRPPHTSTIRGAAPAGADGLAYHVPEALRRLSDPKKELPAIARDRVAMSRLIQAVKAIPTSHRIVCGDAGALHLPDESVHLVLTSPPYWTLKAFEERPGQLGRIGGYEAFLDALDGVWRISHEALADGGRLVCVVGDVCLSRRDNGGRHSVIPLHASILERLRAIGFETLAPIFWQKVANADMESSRSFAFLGKPYEPNAIIKSDVEYVLMARKPGYRSPSLAARTLSLAPVDDHRKWWTQVWTDIAGEKTRDHPAPFPLKLAERLVRMFSFAGDTVLDPFLGSGTTGLAAANWGRNSIGVEIDPDYVNFAEQRMKAGSGGLFQDVGVHVENMALEPAAVTG